MVSSIRTSGVKVPVIFNYEIEVFLPGHIIIGSNGGGELYGIDNKGNYFNVPVLIDEDDVAVLGTEIELLPDKINALWE